MDGITVLKFYADWCMPCRIYAKTFSKVTENLGVATQEINIDDSPDMAQHYGVTSIPTTIILKDGDVKRKETGTILHRDLTHMIQQEAGI
jgi:thioredoxin 1